MPSYIPLPHFNNPVLPNEEAILLYLQRARQALEDNVTEILEGSAAIKHLAEQEFVLTTVDLAITPNGKLLLGEFGVIDIVTSANAVEIDIRNGGLTYTKIQDVSADVLLGRDGTIGPIQEISIGQGLSLNSSTLSSNTGLSRVVDLGTERVILDTYSAVVSRYFSVLGTLTLEGDATLEII